MAYSNHNYPVALLPEAVFAAKPGEPMSSGDKIVLIDDDRVVGEIVSALAKAMELQCDVTRTAGGLLRSDRA